ncbi:MAG: ACP S-malonyltransferase [Candidatus Dormibacteraceae bacterium]
MKLAFLFPGQGSQQAGMGAGLVDDPELARLCDVCSEAGGVDLGWLLAEASEADLKLTHNAQPALFFVGVALAVLLARRGIVPSAAAGHSVGEYAALCAGGAISPEDGIRAVVERGRAMADAVPAGTTTMAAVLGLGEEAVRAAIRDRGPIWPANVNTPGQIVIAGEARAVAAAAAPLKEAGARRVVALNVSAAFHSPFMRPAAERLRRALDGLPWRDPALPVVANVDAQAYTSASEIPAKLERQLFSPVLWGACVDALTSLGCDTFLELGPRRALTGMMHELAPDATSASVPGAAAVGALNLAGR